METEELLREVLKAGALHAAVIGGADVPYCRDFRAACESNACGMYGRCWMCPPDVGPIEELIGRARCFRRVLVYQTVYPLEDSFDIEGMLEAGRLHNEASERVGLIFRGKGGYLHLGAGGCRVCARCAKQDGERCRFPDRALSSLEAYGVDVSRLAAASGLRYINGQNTVTYFGAVFFDGEGIG